MDPVAAFAQEVGRSDALPERLALAIARLAFPDLDLDDQLARLDSLAATLAPSVQAAPEGEARAQALLSGVNGRLGFHGNHERYYDAANSYLNVVLERRAGLPIMLCVVCMALGRRLGLRVEGMGFPGHFMARYQDAAGAWLLDPFHGALVAPDGAAGYLAQLFGPPVTLPQDAFVPVTPVALAQRILNNLRNVYLGDGDYGMAGGVLDYMLALTPGSIYLWQERGVVAYRADELERAARALRRYFFLTNRLHLTVDEAADESELAGLTEPDRELLALLQRVEETRQRLN